MKFFAGFNLEFMVQQVLPESYKRIRAVLEGHAASESVFDLQAVLLDLTTTVVGRMAYDVWFPAFSVSSC